MKNTLKLEMRNFCSADVDDPSVWEPAPDDEVFFQLEFEVAEIGRRGGNVFQATVATPEGLRWFADKFESPFPDRGLLVMDEYSWSSLNSRLESILVHCAGATWQESVDCLRLYFLWEYEGLR